MKIKKYLPNLLSAIILMSVCFIWVNVAYGADPVGSGVNNQPVGGGTNEPNPPLELKNPFKTGGDLFDLVEAIINNIIMPIGGMVAVAAFIWTGFMFVKAQGNQSEISKARQSLLNVAIGTAILLGAWAIANIIKNTVNQFSTS